MSNSPLTDWGKNGELAPGAAGEEGDSNCLTRTSNHSVGVLFKVHPEAAGIAEMYTAVRPALLASLRRRNLALEEAEDVMHDAFVRLLSQGPRHVPANEIQFWLFRVAYNLAIDRQRSASRYVSVLPGEHEAIVAEPKAGAFDPEAALLRNEQSLSVRQRFASLTSRQKHAIELWMFGFTYREIASYLNRSTHSVEELVRRGIERLRGLFHAR